MSLLTTDEPTEVTRTPAPTDAVTNVTSVPWRTVVLVCVTAVLSTAAAAWMLGGVFEGSFARGVAVAAALLGPAITAVSYRLRRPGNVQYLTAGVAVAAGALLVAPTLGVGRSLPGVVRDALFSGGLGQPPVAFDPGWRFLLVVLVVLLGGAASALALGYDRANLAVGVPLPLIIGAALVQPEGAELLSTIGGFVLAIAALAVAYGVELDRTGVSSGRFELQRLLRGLAALVAVGAGLVVLSTVATFLLPEPASERVIPPQRPPVAGPQVDRELFTVDLERSLPLRLGVLDVYEDGAWKTPPFDPDRLIVVDGDVPDDGLGTAPLDATTITVTFTVSELAGRVLPGLAVPLSVTADPGIEVSYDPRTQTLRATDLATTGMTYTVTAAVPAGGEALAAAGPATGFEEFLTAPAPPTAVRALLATLPPGDQFTRLQAARVAYYERVLAAGAGDPVDVSAERVGEILEGREATPFEISAGEALLARWVGVPSRIGYGYYGGDPVDGGRSLRPRHGATWLEVYFPGEGWIAIVGKPPRAKSSFTDAQKNEDPSVRPTDELALITFVPIRRTSVTLLFEVIRSQLLRFLPLVLAALLAVVFLPGPVHTLRRWRRRRWAQRHGPLARIVVAYAELRDTSWDLNIGRPSDTALEFARRVAPDDEHTELAWLVTRAFWGDLRRDLRDSDADAAEAMTASVRRRLVGAQTATTRVLAAASRASLRAPYTDEVPNLWWRWNLRGRVRARLRRTVGVAMTVLLIGTSCAAPLDLATDADPAVLPNPAVPAQIDDITFQREPTAEQPFEDAGPEALVTTGQVYTVQRDDVIEASLQIAALRPGLADRQQDVRDGILRSLGGGRFEPVRIGEVRVYTLESLEQRLILWFSPGGEYYELLVARKGFEDADALFAAVLAFQRGEDVRSLVPTQTGAVLDPRRGFAG